PMSEPPRPIEVTDPVSITVNGESITVQDGELLIDACERNGTYIPRFCYHPRMTSVGMCRMCLVEVDSGRGPALQPSCMVQVAADMTVDTTSDTVTKVQDGVLEYLLINHPLDCPVCDKGGECPLQDQTYAYGPGESRFVEEKRHYAKPISLSETVYMDRERCILCDRCTRFADEVAGDPLIHFINRGSATEVNTFPDEPFSSYFSGNTVQICPVGALTAKPFRFKARPWDLSVAESTCTRCSVGCRITIESSRNEVLRYQGVDSDAVNWSWLCDKGRFGFEGYNSPDRLHEPLVRGVDGVLAPARWSEAMGVVADRVRDALDGRGPGSVAVIGGARSTNEGAYAWARLAKTVIGTDNCDAQLGDGLPADAVLGLSSLSIDELCAPGSTVLWLGTDPLETLPVIKLRLRHAVLNDGVKIVEVGSVGTGLGQLATHRVPALPGESAGVLRALFADGDSADGGSTDRGTADREFAGASELLRAAGDRLRVVVGRPNLAESADCVLDAVGAIRAAAPGARLLVALPRANSRGAIEAGLAPGLAPGGTPLSAVPAGGAWSDRPSESGLDTAGILGAAAAGRIEVLFLLGADPISDFPDRSLARRAIAATPTVVAVAPLLDASGAEADVVLASASFGEVDGTTTNLEGRVSTLNRKVTPPGTAREDWSIAVDLASRIDPEVVIPGSSHELAEEMWGTSDAFAALAENPDAPSGPEGLLLAGSDLEPALPEAPELPTPDSYSLRLAIGRKLYDGGTILAASPSSAPLAGDAVALMHPADAAPLGVDDSTRVKLTSANGNVTLRAAVDPSVHRGVIAIAHNLEGADPRSLVSIGDAVCEVRAEVV
ncbi:MAG: NADH-quinone oxidoreductase subunit NuoG, partial [Microthrixaceae bacterium]